MTVDVTRDELLGLMKARSGHFLLESGHHGDLWLDPDALFDRPASLAGVIGELSDRLAASKPEVVCGPLTGGAFIALRIAELLDIGFCYTARVTEPTPDAVYSARYALAGATDLADLRIAVVDDVINAGSATRSTLEALRSAGGRPVSMGALLTLGSAAYHLAEQLNLATAFLAEHDTALWPPDRCPLCASGVGLDES